MQIGTGSQVTAPNGLGELRKQTIYYFLRSRPSGVLLVSFPKQDRVEGESKEVGSAHLTTIPRDIFEEALKGTEPKLRVGSALTVPPWMEHLRDIEVSTLDDGRRSPVKMHRDRLEARLDHLKVALSQSEEILNSKHPNLILNKYAADCNPKQNPTRFKLWFYTYLVFGRNPLALHYNTKKIGRWDRQKAQPTAKLGAPSMQGGEFGHNVTSEMEELIKQGYEKLASRQRDRNTIYDEALKRNFGCKTRKTNNGYQDYYQPEGLPFPSFRQFWYVVQKHYTKIEVQRDTLGPTRVRSESEFHQGAFTESVCNLMERIEADAYVLAERPRGLLEGTALKPLTVVRIRCVASGAIIGIGFSLGGERASAYRMALFCSALDKVHFCSLFGIQIEPEQWPGSGVPPNVTVDRGPGSGLEALSLDPDLLPRIRTISPAHSGQSKATVEASHPKKRASQEAPEYRASKLTAIEMARREIRRTIKDNDTINISPRLTPDLVRSIRKHTPTALWEELERRGRNDGLSISFAEAARAYLDKHKATLSRKGIEFLGRRYRPAEMSLEELCRGMLGMGQQVETNVLVLPACVRHIWIDVGSRVVRLDLTLPLRSRNDEHYISISELQEWYTLDKEHRKAQSNHRRASYRNAKDAFQEETGKQWGSGTQKPGKAPKQTHSSRNETNESKRDFHQ